MDLDRLPKTKTYLNIVSHSTCQNGDFFYTCTGSFWTCFKNWPWILLSLPLCRIFWGEDACIEHDSCIIFWQTICMLLDSRGWHYVCPYPPTLPKILPSYLPTVPWTRMTLWLSNLFLEQKCLSITDEDTSIYFLWAFGELSLYNLLPWSILYLI